MKLAVSENKIRPTQTVLDRASMIQQAREIDRKAGIVPEPELTAKILQDRIAAKLCAKGIDPDTHRYSQDEE